jgi:hypothetical protein
MYEWLPGKFFLLHTADVIVGNDRSQTHEIIGFEKARNAIVMRYYDNRGDTGEMIATIKDNSWTFQGKSLRFTGEFSQNDSIFSGVWEQSTDGVNWAHYMDIQLAKRK